MLAKLSLLRPLALLLVRLVVGATLIAHAYPKLFHAPFLERFPQMGLSAWAVYVAGVVEFLGGTLLIIGLFTRWAALFISGRFAVAFLQVHWKLAERSWYGFLGNSRDEYPLLLCVVAFLLLTLGAGAFSLDRLVFKDRA